MRLLHARYCTRENKQADNRLLLEVVVKLLAHIINGSLSYVIY